MAVKIKGKEKSEPVVVVEQVEEHPSVYRVIESMTQVNAVAGLKESIELQQKRVAKLVSSEHLLSYTLDTLTAETRLLKDMYNDVIRFQTSASVLSYLRDNIEHGGLVQGALAYQAEASLRDEVQEATLAAMELLAIQQG